SPREGLETESSGAGIRHPCRQEGQEGAASGETSREGPPEASRREGPTEARRGTGTAGAGGPAIDPPGRPRTSRAGRHPPSRAPLEAGAPLEVRAPFEGDAVEGAARPAAEAARLHHPVRRAVHRPLPLAAAP